MSCTRVPLFTKVTRPPTGIVTERGDAPLAVIVIVAALGAGLGAGAGAGEGELGVSLPPPQETAAATASVAMHSVSGARRIPIRKISSKC
jgi:hypothetical protein